MKSDDFLSVFFCVQFGGEANENGSTYYRNRRKARKKIYVLNNGTIMEHGSHDQLLEQKGIYYHLYNI